MSGLWFDLDDDDEIDWQDWTDDDEQDEQPQPDLNVILDKVCLREDQPWFVEMAAISLGIDPDNARENYVTD